MIYLNKNIVLLLVNSFILLLFLNPVYGEDESKCDFIQNGTQHCIRQGDSKATLQCFQTYKHGWNEERRAVAISRARNAFNEFRKAGICSPLPGEKCEFVKSGRYHYIKQGDSKTILQSFRTYKPGWNEEQREEAVYKAVNAFKEFRNVGICKSQYRDTVCDIRLDEESNKYILSEQPNRSLPGLSDEFYHPIEIFPSEQYKDEPHLTLESAVSALKSKVLLGKCNPRNPGGGFCKIRQLPGGSLVLSRGGEIIDGSCSGAAELNRKRRLLGQVGLCDPFISNTGDSNSKPITESPIDEGLVNPIIIEKEDDDVSAEEK